METKKWWQSKTVWLNVISLGLELTQLLSGVNWIPAGTLTLVTNTLNIALRFITKAPIEGSGTK